MARSAQVSTGTKTSLSFQDGPVFTRVHRREGPAAPIQQAPTRNLLAYKFARFWALPFFGLPLRQTEGFLDSLLSLMGLNLKAPDHTTLSRRNQIVAVPPLTRSYDGPIDLIVDSTGLKILGRGEWNAHKHKTSKKRRDWRKLRIGVDAKGFIVAAELTASSRDDASTLPDLLAPLEVPIRRFTADGAYDHRSVYDRASAAGTENVVIVPSDQWNPRAICGFRAGRARRSCE